MAIQLHCGRSFDEFDGEPFSELWPELLGWLETLRFRGYERLAKLARCDPWGTSAFSVSASKAMLAEVRDLVEAVGARQVPPPPEAVAYSHGDVPDEPYGWSELEASLRDLEAVLAAGASGTGTVAIGD